MLVSLFLDVGARKRGGRGGRLAVKASPGLLGIFLLIFYLCDWLCYAAGVLAFGAFFV